MLILLLPSPLFSSSSPGYTDTIVTYVLRTSRYVPVLRSLTFHSSPTPFLVFNFPRARAFSLLTKHILLHVLSLYGDTLAID